MARRKKPEVAQLEPKALGSLTTGQRARAQEGLARTGPDPRAIVAQSHASRTTLGKLLGVKPPDAATAPRLQLPGPGHQRITSNTASAGTGSSPTRSPGMTPETNPGAAYSTPDAQRRFKNYYEEQRKQAAAVEARKARASGRRAGRSALGSEGQKPAVQAGAALVQAHRRSQEQMKSWRNR